MTEHPLQQLQQLGQSVWLDNIDRGLIDDGGLARHLRADAVSGVTTNPTIFDKAIAGGGRYDPALSAAMRRSPGATAESLFFELAIADVRDAADILRPVYEATEGRDGFVSMEVSPLLAEDAEASIEQALWLVDRVDRDNLMVKIPATRAGLPAIEALTAHGVNVNATLLFSVERYREVLEHWLRGIEQRLEGGLELAGIASVASFFVSRVDTAVDRELEAAGPDALTALGGRAAIANAAKAYEHFLDVRTSDRFVRLQDAGTEPQRLLWASTGTKNPDYSDVLYVEGLAGPETVTTLPPATLEAFRDHGRACNALAWALEEADAVLAGIAEQGIVLDAVTERLEQEGVAAFVDSYRHLLATLEERRGLLSASA
ncbi:transaldolase [Arhodomonas sp. SL1]|uniref:transaldolase n=1 Tax=Arhodomonas sp. SL1 TaxID=3425691 RepID=UPI003F882696